MADAGTKSTARLIGEGIDDVRTMVRAEIELAKAGIVDELAARLTGVGLIAGAAALLLPALALLFLALALWLPGSPELNLTIVAAAILVVAAAGGIVGARLVRGGRRRPNPALDTVKGDLRWARDRLKR